ncbi:cytosolic endo-beta-N-acetylglucosaminidase isoform X2 [Hylobates moloch]|uniref:cytosolic endo-beta-N-acetylglucosaminidase isoform X2 n=1 Tax=Hylobates moloch TaxID=81572 RepID=UPI002674DD09|nr:cytosolic endo-beta-N-acetylglucosaminidase isoform X2 [Hylobates moloch]
MEAAAVTVTRSATRRRRKRQLQGLAAPEAGTQEEQEEQELRPRRRRPGRSIKDDEEETVFREVVSFSPDPLPVRYYDKDTTKPISFYLSSLEELLAWTPRLEDGFNVALEPLACRQPPLSSQRPRTLLCHDMMGGYLDDRFIQGSVAQTPYAFYHWQCIDVFVYFSHHTVTIPPVGWTNAAHRHGVCVLGTFITEWNEGGRLCEAFLAGDERSYQAVADRLVQIAQFFHFDGWLINIENSLSLAAVGNTPPFLRYLTTQLHRQVPGGLVLWYDSVVQSGQLKWQDELNQHNRVFFDSCDGFFTNYNWREEHLERMLGQAGERQADVYVGVDVFARGNVVGGRFDTDKSLELIRKHGFSVALFAPGWVYECLEKKDFFQNQDKFWGRLERYLPTHSICSLPFVTSFCLGMGARRVCYGQEEAVGPWYHLSAQEIQPLFGEHRLGGDGRGWVRTHCCLEDAWHGGSSLLVRGVIPPDVGNVAVRLFSLQAPVPPKIYLSMVYKLEGPTDVTVALELTTGDAGSCHIGGISVLNGQLVVKAWTGRIHFSATTSALCPRRAAEAPVQGGHGPLPETSAAHRLAAGRGVERETSSRHSLRPLRVPPTKLARWVGRCGRQLSGGWVQHCYEVSLRGCLLLDLLVCFSRPPGSRKEESFTCRLGEIQVMLPRGAPAGLAVCPAGVGVEAAPGRPLLGFSGELGWRSQGGAMCGWGSPLPAPGCPAVLSLLSCQVVDAASLLAPLPQVQAVTISHVRWQPSASEREGPPALLQLSCTLHWSFLLSQVRCFRIHCWGGTHDDSPGRELPRPEMPMFLGLAFATQYRIVDLLVEAAGPGQDRRMEFLVEPIPKEGFRVPQAEWGRAVLLYSAPA